MTVNCCWQSSKMDTEKKNLALLTCRSLMSLKGPFCGEVEVPTEVNLGETVR